MPKKTTTPKTKATSKRKPLPAKKAMDIDAMPCYDAAVMDAQDGDEFVMIQAPPDVSVAIDDSGKAIKCVKTSKNPALVFIGIKDIKKFEAALKKWFPVIKANCYVGGLGFANPKVRKVLNDFFSGIKGGHHTSGDVWYYKKVPQ